jgi:hypothetical protein
LKLGWAEAGETAEKATTSTKTNESIGNNFRFMVLSPLTRFIDGMFGLRQNIIFLREPPSQNKNRRKKFAGLVVPPLGDSMTLPASHHGLTFQWGLL